MASLTITIGALSRSKSADDTKATNLLNEYASAIGAQGTNAQKADAVLVGLVRHMQEVAQRSRNNEQTTAALAAIKAEIDALKWE
jgi:hypothetical protein